MYRFALYFMLVHGVLFHWIPTHLSTVLPKLLVPTLDSLRNFFLTATTEVLNFFQQLQEVP